MEVAFKTVWTYDDEGYLIGTDRAIESPLERGSGNFIIPGNATDVPPPDPEQGKDARWTGERWELVSARVREYQVTEQMRMDARTIRNRLLLQCDFTQLPDAPEWVDVQTWRTYRQALRDVPQQAGFPSNINWPVPPSR